MLMKKIFTILIIVITIFLHRNQIVLAQTNGLLPSDASVSLNPEMPGANQPVTATASSFSADLNSATISWTVNSKTISSGKGLKTFTFTTGQSNTTTILKVRINTKTGEVINKTFTLKPSNVDLIWQSYGYVPPFYKGKSLFSHQNKIKFVAIPHIINSNGVEVSANNLIYTWTRNGTVLGDFSGYGKNTYTMISSVISRPLDIDVRVTSPSSDDVASASTMVSPVDPTVIFYLKDPLYGIEFQKALNGDVSLSGTKEANILVSPFYFGVISSADSSLQYKWNINNSQVDQDFTKPSRVFRQKDGTVGSSNISLSIENSNKILQTASSGFNLEFNNTTDTATF